MADDWREVAAEWQGELCFSGKNPGGATVQMGKLGDRPGISPMELLLLSLAGCTGMDVVSILTKKRQPPQDLQVRVRGKRAPNHPKLYTEIEVEYLIWGEGIEPKSVEQAIKLSEEIYCSVSATLAASAKISTSYRVLKPGERA
jgi:putative redox protein